MMLDVVFRYSPSIHHRATTPKQLVHEILDRMLLPS